MNSGGERKGNSMNSHSDTIKTLAMGLATGIVIGGVVVLFTTPQSGKKTRQQVRASSVQLRNRAGKTLDGAVSTLKTTASDIGSRTEKVSSQSKTALREAQKQLSGAFHKVSDGTVGQINKTDLKTDKQST
jgi:gas vesicle protein